MTEKISNKELAKHIIDVCTMSHDDLEEGLPVHELKIAAERLAAMPDVVELEPVCVLTYSIRGGKRPCGQTVGADGSGDYAVIYTGYSNYDANQKARELLRQIEKTHILGDVILVDNIEYWSGCPIRIDRGAQPQQPAPNGRLVEALKLAQPILRSARKQAWDGAYEAETAAESALKAQTNKPAQDKETIKRYCKDFFEWMFDEKMSVAESAFLDDWWQQKSAEGGE